MWMQFNIDTLNFNEASFSHLSQPFCCHRLLLTVYASILRENNIIFVVEIVINKGDIMSRFKTRSTVSHSMAGVV